MRTILIIGCLFFHLLSLHAANPLTFIETGPFDKLEVERLFYRSRIREKAREIQFERPFENDKKKQEFKARLACTLQNFETFKTNEATGQHLFCVKDKGRLVALVALTFFRGSSGNCALVVPLAVVSELHKANLWTLAQEEAKKRGAVEIIPFYTRPSDLRRVSTSSDEPVFREDDEEKEYEEEQVANTKILSVYPLRVASLQAPLPTQVKTRIEGCPKTLLPHPSVKPMREAFSRGLSVTGSSFGKKVFNS
jgi:hypothetical protein